MKKSFVFHIHSFAGLISGLFILLMSLSGTILVFHEEWDQLNYPPRVLRADSKIVSIDTCYANLQKQFPGAQLSNCQVTQSNEVSHVFTIYDSSYKNGKEALRVFMHPQMGTFQKSQGTGTTMLNWVGRMHTSFHLGKKGEWLLGFFGGIFVISLLTGFILFRKNIGAVLLFRKRVLRKDNLHQLIGVYALLFNLMIGVTGFWMQRYVFKKSFYKSYNYTPVVKASPPLSFSFEKAFEGIHHEHPDFTGYVIYFSQNPAWNTTVYGSRSGNSFIHSQKYADVIYLDSAGAIVKTAFVKDIKSSDRYDIINSQIHLGQYGGFTVKLIYSLFGITGALLSITGVLLWLKRKRSVKGQLKS
jgi:uncharacterized iron-regulated membrane protein